MENSSVPLALTCEEHKAIITAGLEPYQILLFTVPLNTTVWTERDEGWEISFIIYVAVTSLIFIMVGLLSIMLIIKKDCLRLPTKTFFAIYFSSALFGFSRALCLTLDPYGLFGYIGGSFPAWYIVSRMLGAFGFPSLVASTTLMIFTLLKVTKAVPGKQWYHYWKFIIPIVLAPYVIAFLAELIGNFTPYPALLIIIVCEVLLAIWGLAICIAFLFAGNRLLCQLNLRGRKTVRISAVPSFSRRDDLEAQMVTRRQFALKEKQRHQVRTRRIMRKITIITYGTALFTIAYSLLSIAGAIMSAILLYHMCLGFNGLATPSMWLAFEASKRVNEIVLVVVLLYSITDMAEVMRVICGRCCKEQRAAPNSKYLRKDSSQSVLSTSTPERQLNAVGSVENLNENLEHVVNTNEQSIQIIADGQGLVDSREENSNIHESIHFESPSQYHLKTRNGTDSTSHTESFISNSSNSTDIDRTASVGRQVTVTESSSEYQSLPEGSQSARTKTVGVLTTDPDTTGCVHQTSPDLQAPSGKPVPKPRKSRDQVLNEQRIEALRQTPHHSPSSSQGHILRKQTI